MPGLSAGQAQRAVDACRPAKLLQKSAAGRVAALAGAFTLSADEHNMAALVAALLPSRLVDVCDHVVRQGSDLDPEALFHLSNSVRQYTAVPRFRAPFGNTSTDRGQPLLLCTLLPALIRRATALLLNRLPTPESGEARVKVPKLDSAAEKAFNMLVNWHRSLCSLAEEPGRWPPEGPHADDVMSPMESLAAIADRYEFPRQRELEAAAFSATAAMLRLPAAGAAFRAQEEAPRILTDWVRRLAQTPDKELCVVLSSAVESVVERAASFALDAASIQVAIDVLAVTARDARSLPAGARPPPRSGSSAAASLLTPQPPSAPPSAGGAGGRRSVRSTTKVASARAQTAALTSVAAVLLRLLAGVALTDEGRQVLLGDAPEGSEQLPVGSIRGHPFELIWTLCRPTFSNCCADLWTLASAVGPAIEADCMLPPVIDVLQACSEEGAVPDRLLGAAARLLVERNDSFYNIESADKPSDSAIETAVLVASGRLGRCPWPGRELSEKLLRLLDVLPLHTLLEPAQFVLSTHLVAPIEGSNPRGHSGQPGPAAARARQATQQGLQIVLPVLEKKKEEEAEEEEENGDDEWAAVTADGVSYCPPAIAAACTHLLSRLAHSGVLSVASLLHGGLGQALLSQVLWTHGPLGELLPAMDAMKEKMAEELALGVQRDLPRLQLHAVLLGLFCDAVELADISARESVVLVPGLADAMVLAAHTMRVLHSVLDHGGVEARPASAASSVPAAAAPGSASADLTNQIALNEALLLKACFWVCRLANEDLRRGFFPANRLDMILQSMEQFSRVPATCLHAVVVAAAATLREDLPWETTRSGNTTTRVRVLSLLLQRVERARKGQRHDAEWEAAVVRSVALVLGRVVQHIGDAEELPLGPGSKLVSRLCRTLSWSDDAPYLVAVVHCVEQLQGVLPVGEGFQVDEVLVSLSETLIRVCASTRAMTDERRIQELVMLISTVLYQTVDGVHFALQFSDGLHQLQPRTFDALCQTLESGAVSISVEALAVALSMFSSLVAIASRDMRNRMRLMVPTMLVHLEEAHTRPSPDLSGQLLQLLKSLAPVEPGELEDLREQVVHNQPAGLVSNQTRQELVLTKYLGLEGAALPQDSLVLWVEDEYQRLLMERRKGRTHVDVGPSALDP